MKRLKLIIVLLLLFFSVIMISGSVSAASDITLQKLEITSPKSGECKTGDVITIVATFSGKVTGTENDVPLLKLKAGVSSKLIDKGTVKDNTVEYKYTVDDYVSGTLTFVSFTGRNLRDTEGNRIDIPANVNLTGSELKLNSLVWTDASKVKATIDSNFQLTVSNITELKGHDYYMYIENGDKEPNVVYENNVPSNADFGIIPDKATITKFLELKGDLYLWIYESQNNYETGKKETKPLISRYKLTRPAQKPLGARITGSFFNDSTSSLLYEAQYYETERNIKLKIGIVNDVNILRSIQKGENNALSKLLTYAKSANSIYTGTVPVGKSDTITDKMDIKNKEYYYVYKVLDDENGKYYPVEDVSLYQGLVSEATGKNLFDYLSKEFKWNLSDENNFTDFSKSKAVLSAMTVDSTNNNILTFSAMDAVVKPGKEHKFYFYVSNRKDDVPAYTSELWLPATFTIEEKTNKCIVTTSNIYNLPYIDKLNLSETKYLSIYEVISDEEIKTDKISGEYALGLNAKQITFIDEVEDNKKDDKEDNEKPVQKVEDKKDDTVMPGKKIPQAGETITMVFAIGVTIVLIVIFAKKYKKYNV